jgi:hypothetical protein
VTRAVAVILGFSLALLALVALPATSGLASDGAAA